MATSDRTSLITDALVNGSDGLCELNASTGQSIATNVPGSSNFIVSPDGKYIALPFFPTIELLDQKTLQPAAQFNVTTDNWSGGAVVFSTDSKTLFVSDSIFVNAYNVATGQFLGWIPQIVVSYTSGGLASGLSAISFGRVDLP